jgi:hypothetical protein
VANTFTAVQHPNTSKYALDRRRQINECLKMTEPELKQLFKYLVNDGEKIRDESNMTSKILGEMYNMPFIPNGTKSILDSTGGSGGPLIRQDLEPVLHAIFVKKFPVFDRLDKKPSNGLVHVAARVTSPDSGAQGSTLIAETGTVPYSSGSYDRLTFPIAVFATGRGVTFKETAAVNQGGSPPSYSPELTEMANGMTKLASDLQYFILQGNASNSSGAGASTEKGVYNTNGIDGFRGVFGSVGAFAGNGTTQVDINSLNITESLRFGATQAANNGGVPNLAFLSLNSKQALDDEQQSNVRYEKDLADLVPGTRVNQITYADGSLMLIPFPGSTGGNYNRTSDSALVEDIYIADESHIAIPWLYSESFTVLQIPSAVDSVLSSRWIIFGMYGLEIAAPSFNTKIRRLAS